MAEAFNYVFTALRGKQAGRLTIPMTARFLINDGQHRRASIEEALKDRHELADETIFFAAMSPNVSRAYHLVYDEGQRATAVSQGYFWEGNGRELQWT